MISLDPNELCYFSILSMVNISEFRFQLLCFSLCGYLSASVFPTLLCKSLIFPSRQQMTDGGLLHHVGGKPPETSVIRKVMEMIKTALELALLLLRILREILGLFQDRKHPRRPDQRQRGLIFYKTRPPSCWRLFL